MQLIIDLMMTFGWMVQHGWCSLLGRCINSTFDWLSYSWP